MRNLVYFISDHTGITVEGLGRSLLSQFPHLVFEYAAKPYVSTEEDARPLAAKLEAFAMEGNRVFVFSTIIDQQVRRIFSGHHFHHFDLFNTFLPSLENILEQPASGQSGCSHGVGDAHKYMARIEAIDYTLSHDDGLNTKNYDHADIILVGVSRSGKTPTCLYLAIQYGLRAANFPMTEEDLLLDHFPMSLEKVRHKLFGLMIDAVRLSEIRAQRLPNSRYAHPSQCQAELKKIQQIFQKENIPYLETTRLSIEEIATQILAKTGIEKRVY